MFIEQFWRRYISTWLIPTKGGQSWSDDDAGHRIFATKQCPFRSSHCCQWQANTNNEFLLRRKSARYSWFFTLFAFNIGQAVMYRYSLRDVIIGPYYQQRFSLNRRILLDWTRATTEFSGHNCPCGKQVCMTESYWNMDIIRDDNIIRSFYWNVSNDQRSLWVTKVLGRTVNGSFRPRYETSGRKGSWN